MNDFPYKEGDLVRFNWDKMEKYYEWWVTDLQKDLIKSPGPYRVELSMFNGKCIRIGRALLNIEHGIGKQHKEIISPWHGIKREISRVSLP